MPGSPAQVLAAPRTVRRRLSSPPALGAALAAMADLQPALLDARGEHPEARYAYLAFSPTQELVAWADQLDVVTPTGRNTHATRDVWAELTQRLEASRGTRRGGDAPFEGGWVGVLAHEAASWILGTPVPPPQPPARPNTPRAAFRFYPNVLVVDRHEGTATLIAHDWGSENPSAAERLDDAARRLEEGRSAAAPARAEPPVTATLDDEAFAARIHQLQRLVRDGDCFQVNLTSSFAYAWNSPPTREGLIALYDAYAAANPGAWGGYYELPGSTILSASPECLFDARGGRLRLRPIAGTRGRGADASEDARLARELQSDPKERAEHAMLVDLARNDAAAVCEPGTVHVPNLAGLERYRHVFHLVSEVEGRLRPSTSVRELLEATFPGGTVTGAPKRRAVQRIAETEGGPRGPYTGALGYVALGGDVQFNLLIRTLVATPTHLVAHAGCGIVEGSRAPAESAELGAKARAQVDAALGRAAPAPPEFACGRADPGPAWRPSLAPPRNLQRRVLLIDFEDSFVRNLADYCARLGAATLIHSIHAPVEDAWRTPPSHVLFSPGPGRPEDFPAAREHLRRAVDLGLPVLGVCLGHQFLAQETGARIERHPETVHGRATAVRRTPAGERDPVLGAWRGERVGRYHSLVARALPQSLTTLAELEDGTCMALRIDGKPHWGIQFHPESLLTEDGTSLLRAFLEVTPDARR
jgi:anthranilate synthase